MTSDLGFMTPCEPALRKLDDTWDLWTTNPRWKKNTKQNMILPFKAFEMMVLYEYNVEKYYLV